MGKKLLLIPIWIFIFLPITIWGQTCPSSVSISNNSTGNSICAGTSVTFNASPNGGTAPFTYEWKINDNVQSETSNQFITSSLTNGQVISVTVIDANGTACSITNNGSPITVNPILTPTVNFTIPAGTKCIDQSITFTASNTNGGSGASYEWFVNNSSVQNSTNNKLTRSFSGDGTFDVRVVLTSTLDCVTSQTAEVTKQVTITSNASISVSDPDINDACLNTAISPITFNIEGSATGANVSGLPPGITGSYSSGTFTISGSPTSSGTFNYTVNTTGPCTGATSGGTITVLKDATISLTSGNSSQEVCQSTAIENISYAIGETGTVAEVSGLPTGISGSMSGNNFIISGSSTQTGTFDYSIFATGDCGDSSTLNGTIIINENLTPTVTISSSDADNEICDGTEVTFTASVTNGGTNPSYQWKVNGSNRNGETNSTFVTSSLNSGDSVTVELTSSEECTTTNPVTSDPIITAVNDNLTPEIAIEVTDSDICPGDEVTFSITSIANEGTTPGYQWKVDGNNVGNGTTFTSTDIEDGQTVSVVLTSNETCLADNDIESNQITMEVFPPAPAVPGVITGEIEVCSSETGLVYSVPAVANATSYSWTLPNGWTMSPANQTSNNITVNAGGSGSGEISVIAINSCGDSSSASTLSVTTVDGVPANPGDITSDLGGNNNICPPYSVSFSVTSSGPHLWTVPTGWDIISGEGTNSIQVEVTNAAASGTREVSVVAQNICGNSSPSIYGGIEINNHIVADFGEDQTICGTENSIQLTGTRSFGNATLPVNFTTSGSGTFTDLPGNSNKNGSFNATYLPSAADRAAGQVTLTMAVPEPKKDNDGNICAESSDSITLYIIKDATITDPANKDQTVCINESIGNIEFTIGEAGTGATVTGLPAGLSGNFNNGIFTISGTPTESGSFSYTVNTTGTCDQQTSQTGTITVTPDNTITDANNKDQTVCINTAIADMAFPINSSVTSVDITGMPAGISGTITGSNFIITGTPTESGTFNYTLNTVGSCVSATTTGTLTVNPDVTISDPGNKNQEICINTAIADIEFDITAPGTGATVSGLPDGLESEFSNGIFRIYGTATVAATFDYEVTTTGSCVQVSQTGTIIVNPDPTATISYTGPFCTSQPESATVTFDGSDGSTGGTYTATPDGLTISASSGAITPGSSQPGVYEITYTGPDNCNPAVATTDVTITAAPTVQISYDGPFCTSDGTLKAPNFANGIGNYENGEFSSSQPGGLVIDSETGEINPQNSNPGTYDVFYTIDDTASGCELVTISTEVTITQTPQITISYPETICSSEAAVGVEISATAGSYENGEYSGTAGLVIDENGQIDSSASSFGYHTVTYTIAAGSGCGEIVSTASFTIKEVPLITTDPVNTGTCSNSPAEFEVVASGDDLVYQWYKVLEDGTNQSLAGEDAAILSFSNATAADAGTYYVVVSGSNACTDDTSAQVTLNVDEDITITEPSEDLTICEDEEPEVEFTFIGHANGAELNFQWMKDGQPVTAINGKIEMTEVGPEGANGQYTGKLKIIDPEPGESGDSGVYYVVVDGPDYFTCPEATSKTFTFNVIARPEAPTYTDAEYCLDAEAGNLTANALPDHTIRWYTYDDTAMEYTYIGDNVPIVTSSAATFEYYATQTAPNGCESAYTEEPLVITVLDTPDPVSDSTIEFEYCHEEEITERLSIDPASGAEINWYDNADNLLDEAPLPTTNGTGVTTYYVSQTFTSTGCESDKTAVEVTIKPLPNVTVDIEGGENTICFGTTATLNVSGAASYSLFYEGAEIASGTGPSFDVTPAVGENVYTIFGETDGCTNSYDITINVDEVSEAGTLTPDNAAICISSGVTTLTLEGVTGDITKWEYRNVSTGNVWTETEEIELTSERTFTGLTETTEYRVTVKSGVCSEDTAEATVVVDQLPEGGELIWASNSERIFLTCEDPATGFGSNLLLQNHSGTVAYWEYRNAPSTTWNRIETSATSLDSDLVESVINNFSTTFRAILINGSCDQGVSSATAITSVIVADIKPTPVEVDKEVICIGDQISLSSETGYSTTGEKFEGGQFTESGIKNKGWDFTQPDGTVNDYDAAANNGRADHWLKMNASGGEDGKVYTGTLPSGDTGTTIQWTSELNVNEKFALVTGNNDSYMETPVFSLSGMDEAVFTWDQGYNLTEGATIKVEISTDGGTSYETVLYTHTGDGTIEGGSSGNYKDFGGGTREQRRKNKMLVDLGDYLGQSNLRIRFNYNGAKDGDVWAVDNIKVPEGPQDILLQWYYDEDLTNPDNTLEPIGAENQGTVSFVPRKIGWNDFEVQTRIILDSEGNACQSIDNFETIRVFAFDQYTSTTEAIVGTCGSTTVILNATVYAETQAVNITNYPTLDGYVGSWKVSDLDGNEVTTGFTFTNQDNSTGLDPVNDPNAIFEAEELGDYTFEWILTPTAVDENGTLINNDGCPPVVNNNAVTLIECTTLDYDGYNDYVDLGNNYTGSYFIEAWIRPFARELPDGSMTNPNTGSIISGAGFDISMDEISTHFTADGKWHHIAVSNNGAIYIDGIDRGSIDISSSGSNRTLIGARWNTTDKSTENHFSGWIEEVRIWKTAPTVKQLRFMMNQRLKLDASGTVVTPLQGETVPNLFIDNFSSYNTNGTHNLDADNVAFYDIPASNLAGYYRLISENPDPLGLVTFPANQQPSGGTTPDHALAIDKVPGRMHNITTDQENTSPTPYLSGADGQWSDLSTWARDVWYVPNDLTKSPVIDWNIVDISHNIQSGDRGITVLGLLSRQNLLDINPDNLLRITHYLLLNGNIDLEGESQLIQDHGSILDNSSLGWLEVNQKGKLSSFNYNYWTSPVSDIEMNNNMGYTLGNILFDGRLEDNPLGINFQPGYYVADKPRTNPAATVSTEWIWDFRSNDADEYMQWQFMGKDFTQLVGAGYSMKGTDGSVGPTEGSQEYTFKGKPNNGNIPTDNVIDGARLSIGSGKNYLVGNPFPSAIDGEKFINDNQGIFNGSLYFWDHFGGSTHILEEYVGGYATWNKSGGLKAISNDWRIIGGNGTKEPGRFIPVAQGFFLPPIEGISGGDINFNNTQRVFVTVSQEPLDPNDDDPSLFLQQEEKKTKGEPPTRSSEDTRMKIRLKYESPKGYHRQILVTRDENSSIGFDLGYDAPLIENNIEDMYWWFDENGFVIQGVPDFEKEQILPLAIKTSEGGEFQIKIDKTENWPVSKELYLNDKLNDTIHDILKEPYFGKTETAGEIKDRFELVFFKEKAQDPDIIDPIEPEPELPIDNSLVDIRYSIFDRQVKITNFDMLEVDKVMIFDMGGKLIQVFDELPTEQEIRLGMQPVRSGVYIVKVFCETGICNKKIIVK